MPEGVDSSKNPYKILSNGINYDDFVSIANNDPALIDIYKALDKNGDKILSRDELATALGSYKLLDSNDDYNFTGSQTNELKQNIEKDLLTDSNPENDGISIAADKINNFYNLIKTAFSVETKIPESIDDTYIDYSDTEIFNRLELPPETMDEYLFSNTVMTFKEIQNKLFDGVEPENHGDFKRFVKDGKIYSFISLDKESTVPDFVYVAPEGTPDDGDWDIYGNVVNDKGENTRLYRSSSYPKGLYVEATRRDLIEYVNGLEDKSKIENISTNFHLKEKMSNLSEEAQLKVLEDCVINLYQDDGSVIILPKFNKASMSEINKLIKTPDDEKVFLALLKQDRYKADELINILKDNEVKANILHSLEDEAYNINFDSGVRSKDINCSEVFGDESMGEIRNYSSLNEPELIQKEKGRVFTVDGSSNLYASDGNGVFELKIDKKTFEKLFPPDEKYLDFRQNGIGDCFLLSSIGAMMNNDEARVNLYSLFEQEPNGDISITFPGQEKIVFPKGKLMLNGDDKNRVQTNLLGLKMLEEAYAIYQMNDMSPEEKAQIRKEYRESGSSQLVNRAFMAIDSGGIQEDAMRTILGKNNIDLQRLWSEDVSADFVSKLHEIGNDKRTMILFSTKDVLKDSDFLNTEYNFAGSHAYFLKSYDSENEMIGSVNSWNNSFATVTPLYDSLNYISDMTVAKMKPRKDYVKT